jgi:flagellar biogenesis protein FliO
MTILLLIGALGLALASIYVLFRVDARRRHKKRQHEALRSFYER